MQFKLHGPVLRLFALCFSIFFSSSLSRAGTLPVGEGRDLVLQHCIVCHSLELISQQRMSRIRWDQTITWMQRTQNLWPLGKSVRTRILDYLSLNFGPSSVEVDPMDQLGPRLINPFPPQPR